MNNIAKKDIRKIIHIDMDYFYAQVEMRENPALKGKPVAVGGKNNRSVVAACSYEARKFGVHSAMPIASAKKLCKNLICLPVRMELYRQVSRHIQYIFKGYTNFVEPLSLDEAYLDVSNSDKCKGSAFLIAKEIRHKIFITQKLTASAGIASNKFLAKIASDWNKPNGQFLITPEDTASFIVRLPVGKIFGVGKVTAQKMQSLNINTAKDLQKLTLLELQNHFGKFGTSLYYLCRGIDNRPVVSKRVRKSLSSEITFDEDLGFEEAKERINAIYQETKRRLFSQTSGLPIKANFIKVRFKDFTTTTLQKTGDEFASKKEFIELYTQAWQRGKQGVRLIGLGVQFLEGEKEAEIKQQLSLF